jgi:Fe-S-cluster containining protein
MKDKIFNGQISGGKEIHAEDKMRFDCHPGVACFTRCCKDADMYLYPYDIIRMKKRLGISSDRFLKHYVIQAVRDNPYFPSLMLKMSDDEEKSCPFLSTEGCTIYKDRPFSCRAYPLERAVARSGDENGRKVLYFIFESTFLSRFDLPGERIERLKASDVELMKFGFDWTMFFLTGSGPLFLTHPKKDSP